MDLSEIQRMVREHYQINGFEKRWNDVNDSMIADLGEVGLFSEEIGELTQAIRKGIDLDQVGIECADIVIRIMNFCNRKGLDLQTYIYYKHSINMKRPYLHGDLLPKDIEQKEIE